MTVIIGSICEEGRKVVVTADRMITITPLLEADSPVSKLKTVGKRLAIGNAGDATAPFDIIRRLEDDLLKEPGLSFSTLMPKAVEHYLQERQIAMQRMCFRRVGITIEGFYAMQLRMNSQVVGKLMNEMATFNFNCTLLIAGIDAQGGHIKIIENPGKVLQFDDLGYWAIGAGQRFALTAFALQGYDPACSLEECLLNSMAAKIAAETVPGVGHGTDMIVVTEKEINYIDSKLLDLTRGIVEEAKDAQSKALAMGFKKVEEHLRDSMPKSNTEEETN